MWREENLLRAMTDHFPEEPKFALSLGENLIEQNKAGDARKVFEPLANHADAAVKCTALIGLAHVCELEQTYSVSEAQPVSGAVNR